MVQTSLPPHELPTAGRWPPPTAPARRPRPAALMSILPGGARVYTHRRHGRAVHRQACVWIQAALADLEQALTAALGAKAAILSGARWQAGLRLVPILPGHRPPPLCASVRGLYSERRGLLWLRTRSSLAHEVAHYLDHVPPGTPPVGAAPLHSLREQPLWVEAMATTAVVQERRVLQRRVQQATTEAARAAALLHLRGYDALLGQMLSQSHLAASWEVWARALDQFLAICATRAGWQPRCCRPVAEYATLPEFWSEAALQALAPQIRTALLVRLQARAAAGGGTDESEAAGASSRAVA